MINYAMILGRVGKKDNKKMKNGIELTVLSIATSKKYKDSSGENKETTTWHIVSCFSKLAEIANKYVNVSDLVFVQGEIQNKKIETGERAGQYAYSIHANELRFIPTGKNGDSQSKPNQERKYVKEDLYDDSIPMF